MERCEVLVVGAGIAGTSLAYALARRGVAGVVVVEREAKPAVHASGRSARTLVEVDPNPVIQSLKALGARFLRTPPAGFSPVPLLTEAGALALLSGAESAVSEATLRALRESGIDALVLDRSGARGRCGVLDDAAFDAALFLPHSGFIDVERLIACFIAHATAAGVEFRWGTAIGAVEHVGGGEIAVDAGGARIRARTVVNAAGAWAGELAQRAGCAPVALRPLRRSLAVCEPPPGADVSAWPLVMSQAHEIYFRPLGADLLFCPMDAEPSAPGDPSASAALFDAARPRLAAVAPALRAMRVRRAWAGLRTFSDDGVPIVGRDDLVPSMFWLAGQGGSGIETCAILADLAADLLLDGTTERFDAALLAPARWSTGQP